MKEKRTPTSPPSKATTTIKQPKLLPPPEPEHVRIARQIMRDDYRKMLGELIGEIVEYLAAKSTDRREPLFDIVERARRKAGIEL